MRRTVDEMKPSVVYQKKTGILKKVRFSESGKRRDDELHFNSSGKDGEPRCAHTELEVLMEKHGDLDGLYGEVMKNWENLQPQVGDSTEGKGYQLRFGDRKFDEGYQPKAGRRHERRHVRRYVGDGEDR